MSLTSAFFDAELVGGEYDRVYSAERFAEYFAAFIANGVFPDPATNLQVVANVPRDMTVLVKSGLGWINGYYCNNDGNYPLTISPASGTLPRVDAVVLRWSRSNRSISLEVKTGVATSSPSAPSLERSADNYELMLASIEVVAGATSIAQANITDKRPDSSVCGWVKGVVDQIDTTDLFAQYNDAFQTWFADIQAQLSGDVATNLQNQINRLKNDKVNISDKATEDEAKSGTNDTKWLTSLKAKALLKKYLVQESLLFTTSQTWTVPEGCYRIYVYMISGGASGACKMRWYRGVNHEHGKGGPTGRVKKFYLDVTPGQQIPIVIGAGGVSAYCNLVDSGDDYRGRYGNAIVGGDTSVGGVSTAGGTTVGPTTSKTETVPKVVPMADQATNNDINSDEVLGIAGGSVYGDWSNYYNDVQSTDRFGKSSALAVGSYRASDPGTSVRVKGEDATAYGGGGGGCGLHVNVNTNTSSTSYQYVVQGGKGGNGAALIYPIYTP